MPKKDGKKKPDKHERAFWEAVYLRALLEGDTSEAAIVANAALLEYRARWGDDEDDSE